MKRKVFGRTITKLLFLVFGAVGVACTFTLPEESDFFGGSESDGGQGQDSTGTNLVEAGSDVEDVPDSGLDAGVQLEAAELMIHYDFENITGSTVPDVSTHGLTGTLKTRLDGGVLPATDPVGKVGKGLVLDGENEQYVELPPSILLGLNQMSVTCWLNKKTSVIWERLFDFNASPTVWVYFSPTGFNEDAGAPGTRFAISSSTRLDPEMILEEVVPTDSQWHHVAVVLAPPHFFYYLDGVEKAHMTNMKIHPKDLGVTDKNWIGRSAHATDSTLSARIDEFKVYSGGLTAKQVEAEAKQQ